MSPFRESLAFAFIIVVVEMESHSVAQSWLTATSVSQIQAILLLQLPE